MVEVAITGWNVSGDIGGQGITRWHWKRADGMTITPTDTDNAHNHIYAFFNYMVGHYPQDIMWAPVQSTPIIESATGILQRYHALGLVITGAQGGGTTTHTAGMGARINWRTATVSTHRLMRSATYFIPLDNNQYGADGALTGNLIGTLSGAASNLYSDFLNSQLQLVCYHRPPKGTMTGGKLGPILTWDIPRTPASLRSRRE